MKFTVNSSLSYVVNAPTTFIFNIHALKTVNQTVWEEQLTLDPSMKIEEYTAHDGSSRFVRLKVMGAMNFTIDYSAIVEVTPTIIDENNSGQSVPVVELNSYIASFLYPSRYCQSDKLMTFAYKQFGHHTSVYDKVLAITDWVHSNIDYISGTTNSQTSAMETITERVGVCRDFAHLTIAFCRALSIPARYFTGYAFQLNPPDFHACVEAYIDGNWIIFDPTHLAPLNGLVKIATGRDAADAAVSSIFGNASGTSMKVDCQVLDSSFVPFEFGENQKGICYQ
ncbi:transglutaminase-like domain-containing protein [Pareuzebyella sediminis]|uniref:transglutaminase-like domain-containing protein n=1 Tax=Pareuzebyella sediminis TaxID=2607998 RepID=UPI0011EDB91D|nr:transglutaminase family protein [Pareuzebyella sediminis]